MQEKNYEANVDNDIIFFTVSRYKYFLSQGSLGTDALKLYIHYMFTARLQQTNKVWANDMYVKNGLKWGKDKLQKVKKFLRDSGMIEESFIKDEKGRFAKKIITIKAITKEEE